MRQWGHPIAAWQWGLLAIAFIPFLALCLPESMGGPAVFDARFGLLFASPGIIYGLVLLLKGGRDELWQCPKCSARLASIPADSPLAKKKEG